MAQKIKKLSKKCTAFICMITLVFSYAVVNETGAVALSDVSDLLSDSRFNETSDHTVKFTNDTIIPTGGTIAVAFEADFTTTGLVLGDIDLEVGGTDLTLAANCDGTEHSGAVISGNTVTFTICSDYNADSGIASSSVIEVLVGSVADGGTTRIQNPAGATCGGGNDSYVCEATITTSASGSATAKVAIISGVAVSATVDETLSFTIAGVANAVVQKTSVTTTVDTSGSATTLPFGTLSISSNTIAGQNLTVSTNATGGYTTTLEYTAALTSGTDTISDHSGSNTTPTAFSAAGTEAWGYTTDDAVLGTGTTGRFGDLNVWAALTTSPLEVAYSATPVSAEETKMAYQAGIAGTTEAGTYTTTLFYVTTPIY
ncbi:hypothetical protein KAS31_01205 [Candidatus Parcubacteria bacterium]|nr:hypothetical protein [Candidatus Parcubacteria bacterium]